jgi:hypothetical protein
MNLSPVFDQYLRYAKLPELEVVWKDGKLWAKWSADAKGFDMPVKVRIKGGEYQFITPTTTLKEINIPGATKDNLQADTFDFYIRLSGINKGS